jgi:hypothetical protein
MDDETVPIYVVTQCEATRGLVDQNEEHWHAEQRNQRHEKREETDLLGADALVDQLVQEPSIQGHDRSDEQ